MRGFVPTPEPIVQHMVRLLFHGRPPVSSSVVLDPGAGEGAFVDGILRESHAKGWPTPRIVAVENDPRHIATLATRFANEPMVHVQARDFLQASEQTFDYAIGNPPYVPVTSLAPDERRALRSKFTCAVGRFDLYLLFFEQALRALKPGGRLVFVTPEKFLYVATAAPLRELLTRHQVEAFQFLDEATFGPLVTYPLITMLTKSPARHPTRVYWRDAPPSPVSLPRSSRSLLPVLHGVERIAGAPALKDVCSRISCGVATGADSVFTIRETDLPADLEQFAFPTMSGREILPTGGNARRHMLLVPYTRDGALIAEAELGALGEYLAAPSRKTRLVARTCVQRKPWYAFHESPPLSAMLRPKVLCKDISARPTFIADRDGTIVPRHSVYYIVPSDPSRLDPLLDYLRSDEAGQWLRANCQRAAKGYLRLQSEVLKRLPIPAELLGSQTSDAANAAILLAS